LDVRERVDHAHHVRHLAGEVEHVFLILHQPVHRQPVADVTEVHGHAVAHRLDVEEVAAILGDHRVHNGDAGPKVREANRQVRADKAEAAGDEDAAAGPIVPSWGIAQSDPPTALSRRERRAVTSDETARSITAAEFVAATTVSCCSRVMPGKSGSDTTSRAARSVTGKSPRRSFRWA